MQVDMIATKRAYVHAQVSWLSVVVSWITEYSLATGTPMNTPS